MRKSAIRTRFVLIAIVGVMMFAAQAASRISLPPASVGPSTKGLAAPRTNLTEGECLGLGGKLVPVTSDKCDSICFLTDPHGVVTPMCVRAKK